MGGNDARRAGYHTRVNAQCHHNQRRPHGIPAQAVRRARALHALRAGGLAVQPRQRGRDPLDPRPARHGKASGRRACRPWLRGRARGRARVRDREPACLRRRRGPARAGAVLPHRHLVRRARVWREAARGALRGWRPGARRRGRKARRHHDGPGSGPGGLRGPGHRRERRKHAPLGGRQGRRRGDLRAGGAPCGAPGAAAPHAEGRVCAGRGDRPRRAPA